MSRRHTEVRLSFMLFTVMMQVLIEAGVATGQTTPAAAAVPSPPAPASAEPAAAAPQPATAAPAAPPPPPPAAPPVIAPPPPEAPPPPPPPPPKPMIASNFGVRVALKLQDPVQPKKMSEVHMDTGYVEARFHGDLTDYFGWTANFNADMLAADTLPLTKAAVGVMDLIARFHADDAFNIWAGRLLVPSDRSNFSGPFFMIPWNYPGFYVAGAPLGPIDSFNGRDIGATAWGQVLDTKLKYFAGVYGLDRTTQPYYSGRIMYSIQGKEPGYFGQSTYYGGASNGSPTMGGVVTVGVGAQYQKDGSVDTTTGGKKDTALFMADCLAEEDVPQVGTFTLEGQFYKFNDGYSFTNGYVAAASPALIAASQMAGMPISAGPQEAFYVLAAYMTPQPIGVGKIQPSIRVQQTIDPSWTMVDAQVQYVIKPYNLRVVANYQHIDVNGNASNRIQLGAQLQM